MKQQQYLTLYTSGNKIRFMRVFDGKVAPTVCSVNGTDIVNIAFDSSASGRFFVSTQNGDIHTLQAKTRMRNDIL